jgi:uncharacterized protein (TIGR03437 family)
MLPRVNVMRRSQLAALVCLLGPLVMSGQPVEIVQIQNNYSWIQPGLPNYGIAQGSIFAISGSGMAQSTASQTAPLSTSLSGVTVTVSVSGVTTQAIPYYVSPGQITAVLPSSTPVGDGTVTIASGGQTGSAAIHVVSSAFGLLSTQAVLGGSAIVQNYNQGGQLVTPTNAANPGELLVLWGSGLGPVSGDETQYQTPTNLTNIPIEVDIGGVSATVTYRGRSSYPGLDQINVIVPAGVSGCSVSLVVTAGGIPSNFATIPAASNGRTCSDPGLAPITGQQYQELSALGSVNWGTIALTSLNSSGTQTGVATANSAYAMFQRYSAQQFASTDFLQQASLGSCLVLTAPGGLPIPEWNIFAPLNAGAQINLSGPDGSLALTSLLGGYVEPAGSSSLIVPSTGGSFSFTNGSGGPDVGAFTTSFNASITTPIAWTNSSAIGSVQRHNGQLVTWTGGASGSFVYIFGYSSVHVPSSLANGSDIFVNFTCSAPVSSGQFTVPAAVLNSLPPSTSGNLYVANGIIQQFTAPGLDLGLLFFGVGSGISVPFN